MPAGRAGLKPPRYATAPAHAGYTSDGHPAAKDLSAAAGDRIADPLERM